MNESQPQQCQNELRQSIPWYLNGTLSKAEAASLEVHLLGCGECRADFELHSEIKAAALGREVTPIIPATTAADIRGISGNGVTPRSVNRRTAMRGFAVAASVALVCVALALSFYAGRDTATDNQQFETATSAGSGAGVDYVLQLHFDADVSEPERGRIAAQLDGAVKWNVNDGGFYEVHVQLVAPTLDALQQYEKRTMAIAGVQSAEFTALQLPMR